jgi:integrase/recombinase XerD
MKLNFSVVNNLFIEHLKNRNYSKETLIQYSYNTRHFFEWLYEDKKKEDARDVTKDDIYSYREHLDEIITKKNEHYSYSTKRGMIKTLNVLFRFLSRNEYILINPFDGVNLKMQKRYKERESIEEGEMNKFLDGIECKDQIDIRDRCICELLYGTGLRVSEINKLNVTDIDLNLGKAVIKEAKGRKDRIVPLGDNVIYWLNVYLKKSRPFFLKYVKDKNIRDTLFFTMSGNKINPVIIRIMLKKRFKGKKISPHILRHTFATHMLDNGASLKHVKDILGHNSIQTTVVYTHFNIKSLKRIIKMYHPRENELYEEVDESLIEKVKESSLINNFF